MHVGILTNVDCGISLHHNKGTRKVFGSRQLFKGLVNKLVFYKAFKVCRRAAEVEIAGSGAHAYTRVGLLTIFILGRRKLTCSHVIACINSTINADARLSFYQIAQKISYIGRTDIHAQQSCLARTISSLSYNGNVTIALDSGIFSYRNIGLDNVITFNIRVKYKGILIIIIAAVGLGAHFNIAVSKIATVKLTQHNVAISCTCRLQCFTSQARLHSTALIDIYQVGKIYHTCFECGHIRAITNGNTATCLQAHTVHGVDLAINLNCAMLVGKHVILLDNVGRIHVQAVKIGEIYRQIGFVHCLHIKGPCVDNAGLAHNQAILTQKVQIAANLAVTDGVKRTIDVNFAVNKVDQTFCFATNSICRMEMHIGNMVLVQIKIFEYTGTNRILYLAGVDIYLIAACFDFTTIHTADILRHCGRRSKK